MQTFDEYGKEKAAQVSARRVAICTPEVLHAFLRSTKRRWGIEALADKYDVPPKVIRDNLSRLSDKKALLLSMASSITRSA